MKLLDKNLLTLRGKNLKLNLVNDSTRDVEIASFDLSANVATVTVKKLKLAGKDIWTHAGVAVPLVGTALNAGNAGERTVDAGASPEAIIEWSSNPILRLDDVEPTVLVQPRVKE